MKKTSIRDIAKKLNVSPTTVSLALNGKARENRISNEIEEKVKSIAEEMNYKPNQLARSLFSGKSHTIGVIVADISSVFFSMLAKSVEDEAAKYGYKIMFGSSDENPEKFAELLKVFSDRRLDGYIIVPSIGTERQILQLKKEKTQFVLIDRHFPKIKADRILVDNYDASFNAVQHLINNGYRKIGMLSTMSKNFNLRLSVEGYKSALRANNIKVNNKLIREIEYSGTEENVNREIDYLMLGPDPIDAIFFANCMLGGYGMEKIYKNGLKVPESLAVVSFDDPHCFRYSFSPVTAI